jgi:hypothetical protein
MEYSLFIELRDLILTRSENKIIVPPIPLNVFPDSSFFVSHSAVCYCRNTSVNCLFLFIYFILYAVKLDESLDMSHTFHLSFQALSSLSAEALHQRD